MNSTSPPPSKGHSCAFPRAGAFGKNFYPLQSFFYRRKGIFATDLDMFCDGEPFFLWERPASDLSRSEFIFLFSVDKRALNELLEQEIEQLCSCAPPFPVHASTQKKFVQLAS